jgi:murein L,D-transpeptidase YcbB/YkuD
MEIVDRSGTPVATSVAATHLTLDTLRIRQRPGAANALGAYKFVFPNPLNIYLHDTPADHLFARATRTFSHGCVRVERPEELARHLLRGERAWPADRIEEAIAAGREIHIPLREPVPVYVVYFTAGADDGGNLLLRDDVYARDAPLAAALAARRPPHPAGAILGDSDALAALTKAEPASQEASG